MKTLWTKDDRQQMERDTFEIFHNFTQDVVTTEYHTHDFYEVLFFLSGNVEYLVESRRYRLQYGDVIITNTRELHKTFITRAQDYERYVLWIRPEYLKALGQPFPEFPLERCFDSSARSHHNLIQMDRAGFQTAIGLLDSLTALEREAKDCAAVLRGCRLTELMVLLDQARASTRLVTGVHVVNNPRIDDVVYYVNRHLDETLTLDALSGRFHISKYYLLRLFKEYTGISLHQYVLNKRLLAARELLVEGREPSMVYGECGFLNYSHFSQSYKKFFGYPPSQTVQHISGIPSRGRDIHMGQNIQTT